jgi:hypothetical protein
MAARRLPLLADFGPKYWFQYFITMFGFLGVGAGLFIASVSSQNSQSIKNPFSVIMILGGLYMFIMGFVLVVHPHWFDLSISGIGIMGAAIGFFYFFEIHKSIVFLSHINPSFVKIAILTWMAILLVCFLLSWGAPVEFWQILYRFGINIDEGGLLRNIQKFLIQFFIYS